jgi:hypothetical protein
LLLVLLFVFFKNLWTLRMHDHIMTYNSPQCRLRWLLNCGEFIQWKGKGSCSAKRRCRYAELKEPSEVGKGTALSCHLGWCADLCQLSLCHLPVSVSCTWIKLTKLHITQYKGMLSSPHFLLDKLRLRGTAASSRVRTDLRPSDAEARLSQMLIGLRPGSVHCERKGRLSRWRPRWQNLPECWIRAERVTNCWVLKWCAP